MSEGRGPETVRRLQEVRVFLEALRESIDAAAPAPVSSRFSELESLFKKPEGSP